MTSSRERGGLHTDDPTVVDRIHRDDAGDTVPLRPPSGRVSGDSGPSAAASASAPSAVPAQSAPGAGPTSPTIRLVEIIGKGGMGKVYKAEQLELGRRVAYKQIRRRSDARQRERFAREARLTAQLDHPHIVPVHTLDPAPGGGASGYVMKLVEGKTLRDLLSEAADAATLGRPLDHDHALTTLLEHFLKICDAVSFAHDKGIIHRDLKPANVMIGRFGEVYVMDWGIARPIGAADSREAAPSRVAAEPDLTQLGEVMGSVSYMSPEQAEGQNENLDARSDQYALGLILYEIVSLRRALSGGSTEELFLAASRGEKAPLEHVGKGIRIAPELRAIVARATARAPGDRYASVKVLAEDVRRFMRGEEVSARPDGPMGKLLRFMTRHRRATLAAVVVVVALSAVVASVALWRQATAELAARDRSERVTALYIDVAAQAHRIDAQLRGMESALEGLATAAEWALAGPEPTGDDARLFFTDDFADPARRPADFGAPTRYRWPVSLEHPVVSLAPGTSREAVLPAVRRLAPLRHHIRGMILAGALGGEARPTPEEARAVLGERRSPIDYAYVDLAEGVHVVYPGVDALPAGYDVRTAGFYRMSENRRGKRWGAPYVDSTTDEQGDDLVLPCTAGLWSPAGRFLGVAGVEITVTKLVETSLALPTRKILRASLLDEQGRKVIDSGDAGKRFKASGKDEAIDLTEFDVPEIAQAVRDRAEGVREVRRGGRDELVALSRLSVLGWTYVVEVDASEIVGSPPAAQGRP